MSDHIEWVLEMKVRDGQAEAVQPLVAEMVSATQANEPGALVYEYFMVPDRSQCTVLERYADNAAVMTHLGNFGSHFAERFFSAFEPIRFTVFGPANAEVREALAPLGATFEERIAGFQR